MPRIRGYDNLDVDFVHAASMNGRQGSLSSFKSARQHAGKHEVVAQEGTPILVRAADGINRICIDLVPPTTGGRRCPSIHVCSMVDVLNSLKTNRGFVLLEEGVERIERYRKVAVFGDGRTSWIGPMPKMEETLSLDGLLMQSNTLVGMFLGRLQVPAWRWCKGSVREARRRKPRQMQLTREMLQQAYCCLVVAKTAGNVLESGTPFFVGPGSVGRAPRSVKYIRQLFPGVKLGDLTWPGELDQNELSLRQLDAWAVWLDLQSLRLAYLALGATKEVMEQCGKVIDEIEDAVIDVMNTGEDATFSVSGQVLVDWPTVYVRP